MFEPPKLEPISPETHQRACAYRLDRVKATLCEYDCGAILLYDPINMRYATETTNMQVWTMHNPERYALVFAEGPTYLYEFHHCDHLHVGNELVDEFRDAISFTYFSAGNRITEVVERWADDIHDTLRRHIGHDCRLAVDKAEFDALELLQGKGVVLVEGHSLMEEARLIKNPDELVIMGHAIDVAQIGIQRMYEELRPGMTENELWAWLHYENIRHGGEWIETRLLNSGPRTNPWMQECSDRVMSAGELISFDTDLIGPLGYCADISRAWIVGHMEPTSEQRELYARAHEQIQTNIALLRPGVTYEELSASSWPIPEGYYPNRYCCILHGVGLCDEYPAIAHPGEDWERAGYDGVLQENMVVCVESYIGEMGGKEGVKLEQQALITDRGPVELSTYPWNDHWL